MSVAKEPIYYATIPYPWNRQSSGLLSLSQQFFNVVIFKEIILSGAILEKFRPSSTTHPL